MKNNKKNASIIRIAVSAAILVSILSSNIHAAESEVGIITKTKGCAKDGDKCTIYIDVNGTPTKADGKISSPGDYIYCTAASPGTVGCCGNDGTDQNCTYTCSGTWPDGTAWSQVVTFVQGKNPKIISCS